MNSKTRRALAAGFAILMAASTALAQQQTIRVRGTVEDVQGRALVVKSRDAEELRIELAENARISVAVKVPLSEVKVNSYVAVTAMPQPDGSQRALEVMIFPEAQRGVAEGHGPWDSRPQSTMTNATVAEMVASVHGQELTVKYKAGDKRIIVPPDAEIITTRPGS